MELTLARSIDELDKIFRFSTQFFAKQKIPENIEYSVNLALEEVFTNCVKYNPNGDGNITLAMDIAKNRIVIEIIDAGEEFDISQLPEVNTNKPLKERKVGGLGIHLIKQMMDDIEYYYRNGKNHIIIIKNLES